MSDGFLSQARWLKRIAFALCFCAIFLSVRARAAREDWSAKLDGEVRFYQMTELGVLVAGTEKSLYAMSGETGEVLWRRKNARLDETDVAPVPGTDVLLLSFEKDERTRLEAVDLFTGDRLWQSDKVKGGVMQMAVDTDQNLLAAVFVRDAKDHARAGFKRHAVVHVFNLASGDELWDYKIESEIEMMPARWGEGGRETEYTLDNYHPPFFLDGRLYLFYEGVASLDARTGRERQRERFRVNEEGLALTEADPVFDEQFIYTSGRGHVRAVSRESGKEVWEAKDLGLTPEMLLTASGVLYVRTGGQFTRLEDGEAVSRGSYGVSAIDARTGKTIWRYKGADKGITNIALPDASTVVVADADDLIFIDAETGKRRAKVSHKIEQAAFVLVNERGELVVGGRNEIAAFDSRGEYKEGLWRARYTPPGRGFLRTVAGVAARAASLYFRYGGTVTTVFRGVQLARAASSLASLRWSGLASRVATPNLTTFATERARDYVSQRFSSYGVASRLRGLATTAMTRPRVSMPSGPRIPRPSVSSDDVGERLLDRLDPASQLDKLARFFWRRERLAALRGTHMYFYTDLKGLGNGLAGVNIHNGQTDVRLRLGDPDERFITDETTWQLFVSKGDRLIAYSLGGG
jgi:outer membrane protein assembly factor BamB